MCWLDASRNAAVEFAPRRSLAACDGQRGAPAMSRTGAQKIYYICYILNVTYNLLYIIIFYISYIILLYISCTTYCVLYVTNYILYNIGFSDSREVPAASLRLRQKVWHHIYPFRVQALGFRSSGYCLRGWVKTVCSRNKLPLM